MTSDSDPHPSTANPANQAPAAATGWEALDRCVESELLKGGPSGTVSVIVAGLHVGEHNVGEAAREAIIDHARTMFGMPPLLLGERFAVALAGTGAREALSLAAGFKQEGADRIAAGGSNWASIGVARYPDGADSPAELAYGANSAMHWARSRGDTAVGYWTELAFPEGRVWARKGLVSDPVSSLVVALEWKTGAEFGQMARSAWYARRVAELLALSLEQQQMIETAALVHDIGKLAVDDLVLGKPGALTAVERQLVQGHPSVGGRILSRFPAFAAIARIVQHHHEHFDGSGYPDGQRGTDIPLGSRIILVADAFDAMTTRRAYRDVISLQEAVRELESCAGRQFDPTVVEAFVQIIGRRGLNALHWSRRQRPGSGLAPQSVL